MFFLQLRGNFDMFQYKFYRVSSEIDRTVIHVFGTFRNVQVEMTLAAECIEFFAFDSKSF